MKEREFTVIAGLVALMLAIWLGFVFHQSPRFAGSLLGGVLGVTGALLMLVPLAYMVVKRVPPLKRAVTSKVSMRTLLTWHIYAGVVGPILVVLHTGHKFESHLGIALTAMTLVVVLSGFVGRHLMNRLGHEVKEKRDVLAKLRSAYAQAAHDFRAESRPSSVHMGVLRNWLARVASQLVEQPVAVPAAGARVAPIDLADAIADTEYAIRTHEMFKRAFGAWLKLHIAISLALYALLGLHVWSGIFFGLRWFP